MSLFLRFQRDARRYGNVQPRTLVAILLATLLLMMLANKVLSPQYVAWLLPFGALLAVAQDGAAGRDLRAHDIGIPNRVRRAA